MKHNLKITGIDHVTHDVLQFRLEKPKEITFEPGQAADISINKPGWEDKLRPFTFTSLPEDDYLEFTIKTYPDHKGVTNELLSLQPGDEFILHGVFGAIAYKGKGVFIAGGAGVTPFISIFRKLEKSGQIEGCKLLFANKTHRDIIHKEYFEKILGDNFINILSDDENEKGVEHGFINENILKKHTHDSFHYYICGPEPMMDAVIDVLENLNVKKENIVMEEF